MECIGLGMGVHWDKLGHRVGMQDGDAWRCRTGTGMPQDALGHRMGMHWDKLE